MPHRRPPGISACCAERITLASDSTPSTCDREVRSGLAMTGPARGREKKKREERKKRKRKKQYKQSSRRAVSAISYFVRLKRCASRLLPASAIVDDRLPPMALEPTAEGKQKEKKKRPRHSSGGPKIRCVGLGLLPGARTAHRSEEGGGGERGGERGKSVAMVGLGLRTNNGKSRQGSLRPSTTSLTRPRPYGEGKGEREGKNHRVAAAGWSRPLKNVVLGVYQTTKRGKGKGKKKKGGIGVRIYLPSAPAIKAKACPPTPTSRCL